MRAVVQRVLSASVTVDGEVVGRIGRGLVAFVGAEAPDTDADMSYVIGKIVGLRVFPDESGRMARALADVGGALLFVTQFTLFGDVKKGNRPSFTRAMPPGDAEPFLARAVELARASVPVETGRFGADMKVLVENDGPVTILLDSRT
ncbi:MAG: D-aminoacyl-tRNA deacylase [Polyangiaceae bacterium]